MRKPFLSFYTFLSGIWKSKNAREERLQDRRIFKRMPINLSVRLLNKHANRWGLVQARDISEKGIGLVTGQELPISTPLEIWLPIPDRGESFYTRGEVVWSRRARHNAYEAGVSLDGPDLVEVMPLLRAA